MAISDKKNATSFWISICDLIIELCYKIATNFIALSASGVYFSDIRVELIWTLLAHSVQKINGYWNQYFRPSVNKSFKLSNYIKNYQYYFFYPFVFYVIGCKLLVDYRHIEATVVFYIISKVYVGVYLTTFFNVFIIASLLESLISSIVDWYVNISGKDIQEKLKVPRVLFGFEVLSNDYKFNFGKFVSCTRKLLNYFTTLLEIAYNVLLITFDWSLGWALFIGPMYVVANAVSSYIKIYVNDRQNSVKTEEQGGSGNDAVHQPFKNIYVEFFFLIMFLVMVLSPFIQINVIVSNVALFLAVPANSILANLLSIVICLTFVLHKYIQKGDQVFKYLYGIDFVTKGYNILGFPISSSNLSGTSLGSDLAQNCMSELLDTTNNHNKPPNYESAEESLFYNSNN
ncbi:MAG: hypothetical protein P8L77_00375 [Gammaproteobacteria bacterium]|nr:hypothetical protein [Gammaproteobacteria bacterium]